MGEMEPRSECIGLPRFKVYREVEGHPLFSHLLPSCNAKAAGTSA
jgi:hypothetical protein